MPVEMKDTWGTRLESGVCELCDWAYLVPAGSLPQRCPHCFRGSVSPASIPDDSIPNRYAPELVSPFTLDPARLRLVIETFQRGIPFAPADLSVPTLLGRLKQVYLPVWLSDVEVEAEWQAEVGFDYRVVSHQERYADHQGGWRSRQVEEGRVRWEPRAGRLKRQYQNLPAPALEEQDWLERVLGAFSHSDAAQYQAQAMDSAWVRLPNRSAPDAWKSAGQAAAAAAAGDECRQAAGGDHLRSFHWQPQYSQPAWTLYLAPIYSTFYLDDEGAPRPLLIHGQSGKLHGELRASLKRAQRASLWLLLAALVAFLISLAAAGAGLLAAPLLPLAGLGFLAAVLLGLGAIVPYAVAWQFNRANG